MQAPRKGQGQGITAKDQRGPTGSRCCSAGSKVGSLSRDFTTHLVPLFEKGRLRHPTKFGAINKWRKDYILAFENGIEPVGTYPPFNEDEGTPEATLHRHQHQRLEDRRPDRHAKRRLRQRAALSRVPPVLFVEGDG